MPDKKLQPVSGNPAIEALLSSELPEKAKRTVKENYPQLNAMLDLDSDFLNLCEAIVAFLPVNAAETKLVIEAAIKSATDNLNVIRPVDEEQIQIITGPIFDRSRDLAASQKIIEAVEPVMTIFVSIEKSMNLVNGAGDSFRMIIEDCSTFLFEIGAMKYSKKITAELGKLLEKYSSLRGKNAVFFEEQWAEIGKRLCGLSK